MPDLTIRAAALLLPVAVALVGCASDRSPSTSSSPSVAPSAESVPASAGVSELEGRWATGPIPIADIRASMLAAGIEAADVDAWVAEVGSPSQFSFELEFTGQTFAHSIETPDAPMELSEAGTMALTGRTLVLTIGEPGNIDTYTFDATRSADKFSLRWVDSTEEGTAENLATHKIFTIAFYCSAPFRRVGASP